VDNIDEILAVPGIDAIMIGPYDLSASLGITAEFDHPEMIAATERVLAACLRHRVIAGIHVVQPEPAEVIRRYREGYRFIAYSLDITMLARACVQGLQEITTGLEEVGAGRP
jgi:2-dehydro-3-deoxyglucarate aldolase